MKLRTIDIIILVSLALLCISRATWGMFKDIHIDLSKSKEITGEVISAGVIQIKKGTFSSSKKYKPVFALNLENSDQNFAIDRGVQFSNKLIDQIHIGDTITLFYRTSNSEYNTWVFQIEKNNEIIADFKDYKQKQTGMMILMYAFGFIILGGLTIWYAIKRRQKKLSELEQSKMSYSQQVKN